MRIHFDRIIDIPKTYLKVFEVTYPAGMCLHVCFGARHRIKCVHFASESLNDTEIKGNVLTDTHAVAHGFVSNQVYGDQPSTVATSYLQRVVYFLDSRAREIISVSDSGTYGDDNPFYQRPEFVYHSAPLPIGLLCFFADFRAQSIEAMEFLIPQRIGQQNQIMVVAGQVFYVRGHECTLYESGILTHAYSTFLIDHALGNHLFDRSCV